MEISSELTDLRVLTELGERLARLRLERNLKQSDVAREAGIGLRTLQRLENGSVATRLSSLVRVCRVLDLVGNLEHFLPEPVISPIVMMKIERERPKRASRGKKSDGKPADWTWKE